MSATTTTTNNASSSSQQQASIINNYRFATSQGSVSFVVDSRYTDLKVIGKGAYGVVW
jgi:hypothetical protein